MQRCTTLNTVGLFKVVNQLSKHQVSRTGRSLLPFFHPQFVCFIQRFLSQTFMSCTPQISLCHCFSLLAHCGMSLPHCTSPLPLPYLSSAILGFSFTSVFRDYSDVEGGMVLTYKFTQCHIPKEGINLFKGHYIP